MIWNVAALVLGSLLLYLGAEWLVKGAAGLARTLGIRPLVIGLTVVAYGTSAPELVVAVAASLEGRGAIVLGNSIGSNVANLGLILGLVAMIQPPRVDAGLIRREVPVLLASVALLPLLLRDGHISRLESAVLLGGALGFSAWMIRAPGSDSTQTAASAERDAEEAGAPPGGDRGRLAGIAVTGLAALVAGGKLFVDGAVGVARSAGMSERVVGLTVVAVGTSLPELATSLVAARRGHSDIAVGNVVGSNIFNVLLILGGAGLLRPIDAPPGGIALDLAALAALTVVGSVALRTARTIRRWEGALLFAAYFGLIVAMVARS